MNLPLALQLVLRGDRASRIRLLLMSSGVALGVALLLGVSGVLPALDAHQQVITNRTQAYDPLDAEPRTEGVAALTEDSFWRGRELHSLRFTVVGPAVTPPEGIRALPASREVLVSPALRAALAGPNGQELQSRIPGRITGTVGAAGLTGPDELFFVAPAKGDTLAANGLGAGFMPKDPSGQSFSTAREELKVAVPLAGIALFVPILILVATSTRLSAASRERRTAAMRLVGASRRQVGQLAAVEGAAVGVVGAVAGMGTFLLLRAPVARVLPVQDGVHAASLSPSGRSLLIALVGVPLLAALTAPLSMRRVVSSPLGVSRQARLPKAGPARILPLAAGLGLLVLAYLNRSSLDDRGSGPVVALMLGGAALSLIGLAIAGAALARAGGAALLRWGRSPSSQLAGRRLMLDPSAAARTVTGTALIVAVGGWVLAFIPVLDEAQNGYLREGSASIRPGTIIATLTDRTQTLNSTSLSGVAGIDAVVTIDNLTLVPEGTTLPLPDPGMSADGTMPTQPTSYRALIADCDALAKVLAAPLKGCRADQIQLIETQYAGQVPILGGLSEDSAPPQGRFTAMSFDGQTATGTTIDIPAAATRVTVPAETGNYGLDLSTTVLIPPSLLETTRDAINLSNILIATDSSDGAVEAARTALATLITQTPPLTPAEAITQASKTTNAYRSAAIVGLVVVVIAGGLTLAIGTADGLNERHRAHAALVALGTPMRVLRRSVVLQVATPLLLTVALAVFTSAVAGGVYLELAGAGEDGLSLPWTGYGVIAVAAVVATLLATAAALPLLRAAGRPGALRTE